MNDRVYYDLIRQAAYWLASSPLIVVYLAAGIVCLSRLQTRPRESWLVGSAIVLLLFARLGIPQLMNMVLPYTIGASSPDRVWIFMMLGDIPVAIATLIAWGLVLHSAFGEGAGPRSKYLIEDDAAVN